MIDILLIGDACEDIYHYGTIDRLCPEAPVPVLRHSHTEVRDGMCLNVRNNLQAFGIKVTTLCNKKLIEKQRFVDLRTKQHLLRADFGENEKLNPCDIEIIEQFDFSKFDAVVIADYNKGFVEPECIQTIIKHANAANIHVYVDSKKHDLSHYRQCIIKINRIEYENLKKKPDDCELIVTIGKNGARWRDKIYPTKECDVFDVCGAGDTFLSALVYKHIKTASIEKAIEFANKCSRLVVGKFGTYTLTEQDVNEVNNEN